MGPSSAFRDLFSPVDAESGRSLLYDGIDVALLKLNTGSSASSRILIVVAEGNDVGSSPDSRRDGGATVSSS